MKRIFNIIFFVFVTIGLYAQSTDTQLTNQANVIRNETIPSANTPLRIGNMFRALVDSKKNIDELYTSTSVVANAYVLSINPGVTGYANDFSFWWKVNATNTGTITIAANGLSAKAVKKNGSSALVSGDVVVGHIYPVIYDVASGYYQIFLPGTSGGGGASAFTDLTDVPNSYSGQSNKVVSVKSDESGLEFTDAATGTTGEIENQNVTGTAYTVTDADAGKILHLTNASGCTVTLPNTLTADRIFSFRRDEGAGTTTFFDDGTSVLNAAAFTMDSDGSVSSWVKRDAT